jgi:dihydrofolate reductase
MGKIIANFFSSLDTVVESPDTFVFPYFNEQVGAAIDEGIEGVDAVLMGRQLYSEWSQYWPNSKDEPFASFINSVDKFVLSNTLTQADWKGTTIISGDDAADQLRALKERTNKITLSGSAKTVRWLIANGLLDELQLLVAPIAIGKGARLFEDRVPLTLVRSEAFDTGILHLVYRPTE